MARPGRRRWALALPVLCAVCPALRADPFLVRDQNPLIRGVYLPVGRPATRADQAARQDLTLTISNTTNMDTSGDGELLIDGETTELRWSGNWPLSHGWQLQLSVPVVHYEGGHLDSIIDSWHRFLGLPRGDRPARPEDELEFYYRGSGGASVDITDSHTGLGDSAIEAGYTVLASARSTLDLWLGLELPTGERSALTGNGSVDGAVWLSGARQLTQRWQLDASLGIARPPMALRYKSMPTAVASITATWNSWTRRRCSRLVGITVPAPGGVSSWQ